MLPKLQASVSRTWGWQCAWRWMTSTATEAERQQAGRALAELKGTPMFDQLTAGDAERERRIASLIELHLADYRRIRQPEPPAESIVPGDFSIDDIV